MLQGKFDQHIPGASEYAAKVRTFLEAVCTRFVDLGLADVNYGQRISSPEPRIFWQAMSESLIAHELLEVGLDLSPSHDGPDLLFTHEGRKVWVEIICPEPTGLPEAWITPKMMEAIRAPHDAILLRWTAAIKEKAEKLLGNARTGQLGYLAKGVVGPNDAYIIAVNGKMLRSGGFPSIDGASQWPYAAEATFALGPYAVRINKATLAVVGAGHTYRAAVPKPNGAAVPADTFFDLRFQPISAVYAVDLSGGHVIDNPKPMAVIHNPNATNPIPIGILPAQWEITCKVDEDEYRLDRHPGRLHQP